MTTQATEILPFLYLGSYQDALRERNSNVLGITHILSVKDSFRFVDDSKIESLHVPFSDYGETNLQEKLPACFSFIESARQKDGKILVHCRSGQNRSSTVVVAYLMLKREKSLLESWEWVAKRRPQVAIVEPYFRQLEKLEQEYHQATSMTFDSILEELRATLGGNPTKEHN